MNYIIIYNITYEHWGLWSYVCISPGKEQSFVSSSRFLDQTIGGFRTRNYGFKIRLCHAVFKTPDYGVLYYTSDIWGLSQSIMEILWTNHNPYFRDSLAAEDGNRWAKIKRKPGAAAASYLDGPASHWRDFPRERYRNSERPQRRHSQISRAGDERRTPLENRAAWGVYQLDSESDHWIRSTHSMDFQCLNVRRFWEAKDGGTRGIGHPKHMICSSQ